MSATIFYPDTMELSDTESVCKAVLFLPSKIFFHMSIFKVLIWSVVTGLRVCVCTCVIKKEN